MVVMSNCYTSERHVSPKSGISSFLNRIFYCKNIMICDESDRVMFCCPTTIIPLNPWAIYTLNWLPPNCTHFRKICLDKSALIWLTYTCNNVKIFIILHSLNENHQYSNVIGLILRSYFDYANLMNKLNIIKK